MEEGRPTEYILTVQRGGDFVLPTWVVLQHADRERFHLTV